MRKNIWERNMEKELRVMGDDEGNMRYDRQ